MTIAEDARGAIDAIAIHLRKAGGEGSSEVLSRLAEQDESHHAIKAITAQDKPVTRYMPELLHEVARNFPQLAQDLSGIWRSLHWAQSDSYTDDILGQGFSNNYAWAELIGPTGVFPGDDFTLGLLLLGPERHYIDHYHPAPELYLPLVGNSHWKKGENDFVQRQAGEVIWHPSMIIHATKTFETPLIAAYCWTRDVATPAKLRV
jgi:hypothetical protein